MAQLAPPSIADPVELLAKAVRDHSQMFIDADLESDPSALAGRDNSAVNYEASIQGVTQLSLEVCGVSLEPTAAP